MADDIDRSLSDRLQALRGTKTAPLTIATIAREQKVAVDRAETPSREDALAARLKQLRLQDAAKDLNFIAKPSKETDNDDDVEDDEEADSLLRTDDDTLEHLVGHEDDDDDDDDDDEEQVQALLRELSVEPPTQTQDDDQQGSGQQPTSKSPRVKTKPSPPPDPDSPHHEPSIPSLPSLPPSLAPLPSAPPPDADDDMASRLAALRRDSSPWTLPSVPSAQPSSAVKGRLSSRYGYTDDDVDSWCTVCLEDATLRCLGCDHDPYCARCWREMHRGPSAAFDDRFHRAVQFTGRSEEKKVVVGAS